MPKITLTLECSDEETAGMLMALYTVIEHNPAKDRLDSDILALSLCRAFSYIRDQLGWPSNLLTEYLDDDQTELLAGVFSSRPDTAST